MANHVNLVSCNCLCAIFLLFFLFHKSRNVSKFLTTSIRAWSEWKAMVEDEGKKLGIGKFDSTNFGFWRMQIKDYLYEKKLHLPLLGEQQDDMEDAYWQVLDRHVLGVIRLTLSRTATHNIVKEKTILDAPCCLSTALQTRCTFVWSVWRAVSKQQGACDVVFTFTILCWSWQGKSNNPQTYLLRSCQLVSSISFGSSPKVVDVISSQIYNSQSKLSKIQNLCSQTLRSHPNQALILVVGILLC